MAFGRGMSDLATTVIQVGLPEPVAFHLRRRFELAGEFLGAAASSQQFNDRLSVFRRVVDTFAALWTRTTVSTTPGQLHSFRGPSRPGSQESSKSRFSRAVAAGTISAAVQGLCAVGRKRVR